MGLGKAEAFAVHPNDEVVMEWNTQYFASVGQRPSYSPVLTTWQDVPRWMVVADNEGRNPLHDCEAKDFTWMYKACIEGADCDHFDIFHYHFGIQTDGPKMLFVSVSPASSSEPES